MGTNSSYTTSILTNTTSFFIEETSCGPGGPRTQVTVSVTPLPNISISSSDSIICAGQSSTLIANGASTYTWSPIVSTNSMVSVSPSATSNYTVVGFNGICTSLPINITVTVIPTPTVNVISSNNIVCLGSSVNLTANGAQSYSWSPSGSLSNTTGSINTANPNITTTYSVTGYNTLGVVSCSNNASILLTVVPYAIPVISESVSICQGDNVTINAGGGNTFTWSPISNIIVNNGSSIIVSPSVNTVYNVMVANNNICPGTASVMVYVNPTPTVNAGRDTTFNLDEQMYISAVGNGTVTWVYGNNIWCKDCPFTPVYPSISNCYIAEVINEFGCRAQDMVCIEVTKEYTIYIPDAFSPNGDGINELFFVYGDGLVKVSLRIYNRWGEELFHTDDQTVGWNGTYKGKPCELGVYVYKLSYEALDGRQLTKTGHISLIK